MVHKATLIRFLRRLGVGLIAAFVLLIVILRVETYRFKHKAERLMDDFQSINLRHSSWPDAERLIRRWGAYGSYQGECTSSFCRYTIVLDSPETRFERWPSDYLNHRFVQAAAEIFFAACQHLGGKAAILRTSMVVQDNVVVRKSAVFEYEMPFALSQDQQHWLIATSHATSRLTMDGWPLIHDEQLAEHPFYVIQGPGGCSFCEMVNVTFTPDTPNPEMSWLTTFNLGCLTRLHSCRQLHDIYPPAKVRHASDEVTGPGLAPVYLIPDVPLQCRVPLFARGREADQILSVTPLTEAQERQPGEVDEKASVRLESVLKGSTRYKTGEVFLVTAHSYSPYIPLQIETPLTPGGRFLLLSMSPEDRSEPLALDRCLVLPDTPEARAQLQQGIAQNDSLRYPDPHSSNFIPE